MKDKLEPNMYVRTKKGNIYKFETNNSMAKNGAKKYMVNCSYNLIDLIQIGDYVNGEKVEDIILDNKMSRIKTTDCSTFFEEEIISIVTKEQFEQMAYKVGD